jgi:hypothetical protein
MKRSPNMAPLDEKFQNDATFQCLLSSQRELLSRLKSEKQLVRHSCRDMDSTTMPDPWTYSTNQSIGFETFRNDNFALSKRMSLGIGADDLIMPSRDFDSDQFEESLFEDVERKREKCSHCPTTKKRRRSTLSFLDYIFENGPEPTAPLQSAPKRARNRVEFNDSDDEDYGVIMEDVYSDDEQIVENNQFSTLMDPEKAKETLTKLNEAMGQSQGSQQQIHDWDKKMGLKRSHSKTMRLSSRSRKQLRLLTQNDIMFLSDYK